MKIDYPRAGRSGYSRFIPSWKLALGTVFSLGLLLVLALVGLFTWAWFTVQVPDENSVAQAQTTIIYWDDAKTEMARIGDTNRISIPLSDVPLHTQQAVLAAEDRDFYHHGGFSMRGFARAMWTNLRTGSSQGGSTITQQFVKNAFLNSQKTYSRKLQELVVSVKLESRMSKDEILQAYLNTIFFGRGAYGIQTASEAYFGIEAKDLTLEQSAVLASIINAPGLFNPDTHLDALKERYAYVLDGMLQTGAITQKQHDKALKNFPKIFAKQHSQTYAGTTGYLLAAVEKEVLDKGISETDLYAGGLRITSTFNQQAQDAAVAAVKNGAPTINAKGVRIGLASVVPGTGEVVAMYGGADYLKNSLNNATQAIGQAGSTFKPFALVAATQQGISPWSTWPGNSPSTVNGYTFQNYGNTSYGSAISLLSGTQNSVNSVFVKLTSQIGVASVREAALAAGIPDTTTGWEESNNLTFVLGTASPHPLDVADAYATFAASGVHAEATMVNRIESSDGKVLYKRSKSTAERTIDAEVANRVNWYLQSVVQNGTGRPALALGRPAAGKTGSTDEYKSAWFAGYTPQLATAVMFIKEDSKGNPISLSGTGGMAQFYGGGYPARIWTSYMRGALSGQPVESFTSPTGQLYASPTATATASPTATATVTATPTASASAASPAQPTPTTSAATPAATATAGQAATPAASGSR